jgi:aminomethyltransferase
LNYKVQIQIQEKRMPERRTPLYDIHLRTASKMVKGGGDYMYPLSYTSPVEEHNNTRANVGMQDLSTMGEVDIKGPGAERLVYRLIVAEVRDMEPGQLRYASMCRQDGGMVDDITVYKFSDEHFMIVTSSGPRKKSARWISDHATGASTYVTDMSGAIALLSVQGPRSKEYLQSVIGNADLEEMPFFRFTQGKINDSEVLISRSGYTGELGYELLVPSEEAAVLWEHIIATGKEFSLKPYGVEAMQSLRIEKAFPLYGPDISEEHTPFHMGLQQFIDFDKRDFIGREALLQVQDMGLDYRWTGMHLEGDIPANTGDRIYSIADIATFREKMFSGSEAEDYFDREVPGMEEIGTVTSSSKGHTVGKLLALGHLGTTHTWPGSKVLVRVNDRPQLATVVSTPFFDPQGSRMRATGPRKV